MSKKTTEKKALLQEAVMRRFGIIAGLRENAGFQQKLSETYPEEEEEMGGEEEMPMDDAPPMEEPMDELPPAEEAPGGGDEALVQDIVSAVADAIQGVTGVAVSVSGAGGEEAPMEEPGMEEEPPMDMGGGEMGCEEEELDDEILEILADEGTDPVVETKEFGGTGDMKMKDAKLPTELSEVEEPMEEGEQPVVESKKIRLSRKQLVSEVVKRVVARLQKEAKAKRPTQKKNN